MGTIIQTKINRFDGGITNNSRDSRESVARVVSNFDVFSNPRKMTPYRSSESGDSSASTSQKQNFAIARRTGTTYSLYALGVISGLNRAEVLYKDLTTGSANDLDDATWATPSNNQSSAGATNFNLFVFYRRTGLIYGARAGTNIWAFSPTGSAWADSHQALTYTEIGQGVVHSKDDILYIPYYDNAGPTSAIARNNNGTWNTTALTLPRHLIPVSIAEYGNFLAIGCTPESGFGNSRVFLWDRDATLTTLSESIDWGPGSLMILEEVDGVLIGISQEGGASSDVTGNPSATTSFRDKIVFRALLGNRAIKLFELQANHASGSNNTLLPLPKQKVDNRLWFLMKIELNGAVRDGLWSFGRSSPDAPFSLIHEQTTNNDTALTTASSDALDGFIVVGNVAFIAYRNGGTYTVSKTDADSATYSHNSVYESKRFDGGDPSLRKDLLEFTIFHEYLPSGSTVTIQYRVDQNTSWTTILTNTTANSISATALTSQTSPAALPKNYKEIEFRIVGTGANVEFTGFSFKEEIMDKKPN